MSSDLWLGALLSVPIGIATALITPSLQRSLENTGKKRVLNRARDAQKDLSQAQKYKDDRQEFSQYLIHIAVKTTFIGAAMGIISGLVFEAGQIMMPLRTAMGLDFPTIEIISTTLFSFGQLTNLVGSVMIVNTCRPALAMWDRVRNFDVYKIKMQQIIDDGR